MCAGRLVLAKMAVEVKTDSAHILGSINRLRNYMYFDRPVVMRNIGTVLRDYVRQTITMQGRKRPYAPLAQMTKMRTGRRKALVGLRTQIKYRSDANSAEVYFEQRDPQWHIDMHHRGFRSGPVQLQGKDVMAVPQHGSDDPLYFKRRKEARIPAREVWPVQKEVRDIVSRMVTNWINSGIKSSWRP